MASVREMAERKLEGIEQSVQELRDELDNGDFGKLTSSADSISEQADELAQKFQAITQAMGDDDQADEAGEDEPKQKQAKQESKKASG